MLSVDNINTIRNHLGHSATDELLGKVAEILQLEFKYPDGLYQLSSESFLAIHDLSREELQSFCSMLRQVINANIYRGYGNINLAMSFSCTKNAPGKRAEIVFRELQATLLQLQGSGHLRIGFFDEIHLESFENELKLQAVLVRQIAQNQVEVWFQPKVQLATGAIVAVEALARIQEEGEFIPPDKFILIAEKYDLINDLGNQIIYKALTYFKRMPGQCKININLSPIQLLDAEIIRWISALVEKMGLPPERIIFEITETALMQHYQLGIRHLHELRQRGFGIALDDFGTGYSSFSYLIDLPVTEIKLDRSLLLDIEQVGKKQLVLRSLLEIARELKIDLVAEGIENETQLAFLREAGCQLGQGFLMHRPMPFKDFCQL